MAENSAIEWTHHTMNFWVGCTALSPACDHCYAEAWAKRTGHPELWSGERRRTSSTLWQQPLKWNRRCADAGLRERVFTNSLADFFDNQVPSRWRDDAWHRINQTPNLDWMVLSKRPENVRKMLPGSAIGAPDWNDGWPNVWLGTTVEDQARKRRVDVLREVPARVRFLSIEPLLEELGQLDLRGIHLVIVGGESGLGARPMHPAWVRSIRDQCAAVGVAFFFKQWGAWLPGQNDPFDGFGDGRYVAHWQDGTWGPQDPPRSESRNYVVWSSDGRMHAGGSRGHFDVAFWAARVGKARAGRLLDGVENNGMPPSPAVCPALAAGGAG